MNYLDEKFQWYSKGIKTIKPNGFITLRQLINTTISPKPEMVEAFKLIQDAGARGDKAEKDRLKAEKLFFTTPSAIFNPIRNYDSIKSFTPFGVYEYDDIDFCDELRDYIFQKRRDCIFAFSSPSKTGCKFVFLFGETPTSIEHYKTLWFGIAHDLDKFKNLDMSNKRCTQPLYNSYDPDARFREDAIGVVRYGYKENSFIPFEGEIEIPNTVTEEDKNECIKLIRYLIDRIIDSGHNQVLSASFMAGGLNTFYGIDLWGVLEESIKNNDYLSKGTEGYLKTALTMYNKGLGFPKPLKKKEND